MRTLEEIKDFIEMLDDINEPIRSQWGLNCPMPSEEMLSTVHLYRITDVLQFAFTEQECIDIEELLGGGHGLVEFFAHCSGVNKRTSKLRPILPAFGIIDRHLTEYQKNRRHRLRYGWNARKMKKKYIFK